MSRTRGLLGHLRRRGGNAEDAVPTPQAQEPVLSGGDPKATGAKRPTSDLRPLLEALNELSLVKQIRVHEMWPEPEIELDRGVRVTARTKKERRRFTRPIDAQMLEWLGAMAAGDVFYDVGANCGSLTLAAGAMHRDGVRIVAIEPAYGNFESLARNLSRNGMLGFVVPLQVALLDGTRLEPINYHRSTDAGTSLHAVGRPLDQEDNEFTPVETQMVPAYALDDLIDIFGLPEPTHVKIDVDGTEGPLLQGGTKTLAKRTIKELLIEIVDHNRAGTRLSSVTSLLERDGYKLADTFSHQVEDSKSFVADYLFRRNSPSDPTPSSLQGPVAEFRAAAHERAAQPTLAGLERELERSAAMLAGVTGELDELRRSYHVSGAAKKLDIREVEGFSELARGTVAAGRTRMNYDRLFTLWQAVRAAPPDKPAIEIGSYRGGSARFIGEAFQASGGTPRLYVCDTFAGHAHTDPTIDTAHHSAGKFENASAAATAEYLSSYPALELVVGDIVETSTQLRDEEFGLVHLDVDVYPTSAFCLRFFAPRLAENALMVIDDYGFVTCPGVKQAADEFVAEFPQFRLWHLLTGQAILWRLAAPG